MQATLSAVTDVDVHADWSPLDDLVALHSAEDADELRRRLILFTAAPGNAADAFEPWCLLHAAHKDKPDGAVATALLLLTDRRWRNATGRLIGRIEESDLIPPDHLDLLAQTFVAADAEVYWEVPADWFGGPAIVIDFDQDGTTDEDPASDELDDDADDGPVVAAGKFGRRCDDGQPDAPFGRNRPPGALLSAAGTRTRRTQRRGHRPRLLDSIDVLAPRARALRARRCRELASPRGPRSDDSAPEPGRAPSGSRSLR